MKIFALITLTFFGFTAAFAQNEKAPIVEKDIDYRNWNYKEVRTGENIDLRDFSSAKKLVLVVYFAPWCPNWRHEAPFAEALYKKYKSAGLDVIGVSEYDTAFATKNNLDELKVTFPVVFESQTRDDRIATLHYKYRSTTGDTRKWGSPWNLFILPQNIQQAGDLAVRKAPVVNGELIEPEVEKFVRERLGVTSDERVTASSEKKDATEVCDPEKQTTTLKKPQ